MAVGGGRGSAIWRRGGGDALRGISGKWGDCRQGRLKGGGDSNSEADWETRDGILGGKWKNGREEMAGNGVEGKVVSAAKYLSPPSCSFPCHSSTSRQQSVSR